MQVCCTNQAWTPISATGLACSASPPGRGRRRAADGAGPRTAPGPLIGLEFTTGVEGIDGVQAKKYQAKTGVGRPALNPSPGTWRVSGPARAVKRVDNAYFEGEV